MNMKLVLLLIHLPLLSQAIGTDCARCRVGAQKVMKDTFDPNNPKDAFELTALRDHQKEHMPTENKKNVNQTTNTGTETKPHLRK